MKRRYRGFTIDEKGVGKIKTFTIDFSKVKGVELDPFTREEEREFERTINRYLKRFGFRARVGPPKWMRMRKKSPNTRKVKS